MIFIKIHNRSTNNYRTIKGDLYIIRISYIYMNSYTLHFFLLNFSVYFICIVHSAVITTDGKGRII